MALFRRGSSSDMTAIDKRSSFASTESQMGLEVPWTEPKRSWLQARRRKRRTSSTILEDDEDDPYASDTGESYREHCEQLEEASPSKSCLSFPKFLKKNASPRTVMDMEEKPISPQSLPKDLARLCYSLRSEIGDGSLKSAASLATAPTLTNDTNSTSFSSTSDEMQQRMLRPNHVHINVSHWSDFGKRDYMEDRYAIEDMGAVQVEVSPGTDPDGSSSYNNSATNNNMTRRLKMPLTWVGVFDGHGGDKASQFCSDWMSSYVKNETSYPYDLGMAMKNAFQSADDDFVSSGHPDGSTACTATLVGGRRIVCANAGDSRAIVVRKDGSVVRLSRDHKPGVPDETKRITDLGGRVIYWGRWRVEGLLAVSRSIGDASLKPYVSATPEVCEYDIGKDDWFLLISSDGVWDVMDNEEAAHVIIASACVLEDGELKIDTERFKWAARNLIQHAKSCGSLDNFSAIVVDLKSCGNPSAKSGTYEP
eukprot:scaffold1413_cov117-Cylindrotheca_fusiformis.AAC.4